jgi:hypothetical protein
MEVNKAIEISVTGTAPLNIVSATICQNLNADLLDGNHATTAAFNANKIQGTDVWSTAPSAGQILVYNGTTTQYEATANEGTNGCLTAQTVTITGATATPDFSLGNNISIAVNTSFNLDATAITANKWGLITFTQDSTGGYTISYAANKYRASGSTSPVLSATASAIDVFQWWTVDTARIYLSPAKNFGDIT